MTLFEIANSVGAAMPSGPHEANLPIARAASLEDAEPGDIVFYEHPKYLRALRETRASVALVPMDFAEEVHPLLLRVERPSAAFTTIVASLAPRRSALASGIHPTASIDPTAEVDASATVRAYAVIEAGVRIGARTVVGAHTFVGRDARIGEDCLLHANATLHEGSILGARVTIQSGAVIGSEGFGYQLQQGKHVKVPHTGHVELGDDVEIGACTTIDRARFGRTWIQRGTKIDNLVQIAHNVIIGPDCLIVSQTGIAGSARLGRYVTLAGQVGVVGHITVGDNVLVTAKSGISKDTPAGQQLMGTYGIPIKEARELVAHYHRLPKTAARIKALEAQVEELRALVQTALGQAAT